MPSQYIKKPKAAKLTPTLFADWDDLPDGWELMVDDEIKAKRFHWTGERIAKDRERYEAIMLALGQGVPVDLICKAFHVHHKTVAVIGLREKKSIDDLKKETGEIMLKAARWSVRSYVEDLAAGKVDPKTKAIAAGIFSQNGLVLSGQPSAILAVEDRRELTPEAINGFWERAKRIKEAVVVSLPAVAPGPEQGEDGVAGAAAGVAGDGPSDAEGGSAE